MSGEERGHYNSGCTSVGTDSTRIIDRNSIKTEIY